MSKQNQNRKFKIRAGIVLTYSQSCIFNTPIPVTTIRVNLFFFRRQKENGGGNVMSTSHLKELLYSVHLYFYHLLMNCKTLEWSLTRTYLFKKNFFLVVLNRI